MNIKKAQTIVILSILLTTFLAVNSISSVSAAVPGWGVKITATLSYTTAYSADCTFGVRTGATNSFDSALGDQVAAPPPVEGVSAWFAYPNDPNPGYVKLSTSYISDSGILSWTYKVKTDISRTMTLSWSSSDVATIPSGFNIYLADSTGTTTLADMKAVTSYAYAGDSDSTKTFTILLVPAVVVPEYPIAAASIIAFVSCLAAFGITKIVRNKNHNLTVPSF